MTEHTDPTDETAAVRAHRNGGILEVVLDRPHARNALNPTMTGDLVRILTDAASDDDLRAVHLRGEGENFCAGADWIGTNSRARNEPNAQRPRAANLVRRVPHEAHRIIELVHTIALPVVCSVRGWAVGLGCNLALAADFTIADDDAVFWEPFLSRGFSPDSGATWLLPRLVGLARARRMLLLGEKIGGSEAADWGLIHHSVPTAELDRTTDELLARLAAGPTVAIGLAKQAIAQNQHATLDQAMTRELYSLELACRTGDFKEGLAAFRQRRTPEFEGR